MAISSRPSFCPPPHFSLLSSLVLLVALLSLLVIYQQFRIQQLSYSSAFSSPQGRSKRSANSAVNSAGDQIEYLVEGPKQKLGGNDADGHLMVLSPAANKREDGADGTTLLFPLYMQISKKMLQKICCLEKYSCQIGVGEEGQQQEERQEEKDGATGNKLNEDMARRKGKGLRRREKVCAPVRSLGPVQLVGRRLHRTGCAMRRADRWFLTEYRNGYMLFQFLNASQQNGTFAGQEHSLPRDGPTMKLDSPEHILTLPAPFRGSDHTVSGPPGDETFFYELASTGRGHRVQGWSLRSGRTYTKLVYADNSPLYGFAPESNADEDFSLSPASSLDLEADQLALWVLFRRPTLSDSSTARPHLSVLKLAPASLEELGQWDLKRVNPNGLVNAFVTCGILHTVEPAMETREEKAENEAQMKHRKEGSGIFPVHVSAIYDFRSGKYLRPNPGRTAGSLKFGVSGPRNVSSVQYDPESDSLTVFDSGNIYTVPLQRKDHRVKVKTNWQTGRTSENSQEV